MPPSPSGGFGAGAPQPVRRAGPAGAPAAARRSLHRMPHGQPTGYPMGNPAFRGKLQVEEAMSVPRRPVPELCLAVFAAVWVTLAIAPWNRGAWVLENLPSVIGVGAAVATYRRFRFSDRAYVLATIFLVLHTVGSHFTYALMPLGAWLGEALGAERNHYDRFVHLAYPLLMLGAIRELFFRPPASAPLRRQIVLSAALAMTFGTAWELLEWLTAVIVDPAAGTAFLATQGDPWDAQKDLAMASVGALFGGILEARRVSRAARRWRAREHESPPARRPAELLQRSTDGGGP